MPFIIIPIRYGYVESGKFLGWVAMRCNYCQTVQPNACYDMSRHNTLYSMKVSPSRRVSKKLVCSFCNESIDLSAETSVPLDRNWNPPQGIQALVNSTNPALGIIDRAPRRSNGEIKAILGRMEEWTNQAFHDDSRVLLILGAAAVVSFIFGALVGGYLPQIYGIDNFIIVYGVLFAVIGCVVAYFIARSYFVKQDILDRLSKAGVDKGIGKDEFIKALATMPRKKKQLEWAVFNLNSR